MGFANLNGRARTNPNNLEAQGVCDRCGIWYSLNDLVWQFEYAGSQLINQRIRVCKLTCLDVPQPQLKPRILPPDPRPVRDPRPENFYQSRQQALITDAGNHPSAFNIAVDGTNEPITIEP